MSLTLKEYALFEDWKEFFKGDIKLRFSYDISWHIMFSLIINNPKYEKTIEKIKDSVEDDEYIFPKPKYLLRAFQLTSAYNIKVVILGQDPYINLYSLDDRYAPQAMGLSFSVPDDCKIPPSLVNIFKNQKKYKHIKKEPDNGNLWYWALQGVLLLNSALTVRKGKSDSHAKYWEWMSNDIIEYISDNFDNIVFMLWGANAYKKMSLIDLEKHKVIVSSHPSPYSAHKPFRKYGAFNDVDHFGICNQYLEENDKKKIYWSIPNINK